MVGLGVEDTSDAGGGKNIGYTHEGDYADYLIYSKVGQKYSVDFRVASNANGGKVGLFLVEVHIKLQRLNFLELVVGKNGLQLL